VDGGRAGWVGRLIGASHGLHREQRGTESHNSGEKMNFAPVSASWGPMRVAKPPKSPRICKSFAPLSDHCEQFVVAGCRHGGEFRMSAVGHDNIHKYTSNVNKLFIKNK
jgi:hypothetical protein